MRELKFRIWAENVKRWLCEDSQYLVMDGSEVRAAAWSTINFKIPSENFVIEQYTGLKDKNGREIYEGDILSSDNNEKPCNYTVKWNDEKFNYAGFVLNAVMKNPPEITAFIHDFKLWMTTGFTIIGNIHENPSLLT